MFIFHKIQGFFPVPAIVSICWLPYGSFLLFYIHPPGNFLRKSPHFRIPAVSIPCHLSDPCSPDSFYSVSSAKLWFLPAAFIRYHPLYPAASAVPPGDPLHTSHNPHSRLHKIPHPYVRQAHTPRPGMHPGALSA